MSRYDQYIVGSVNGDWVITDLLAVCKYNKSRSKVLTLCECGSSQKVSLKVFTNNLSCGCKDARDLVGKFYKDFQVLTYAGKDARTNHMVTVSCNTCSKVKDIKKTVVNNNQFTCDHGKREYHGKSDSLAYSSWGMMKFRCETSNHPKSKYYHGKGISYPESWKLFSSFLKDMGERPEGTTLDRIDSNLDYSKENCRWADIFVQTANTTRHGGKYSNYKGAYYSLEKDKWFSTIKAKGVTKHLGYFPDEVAAAKAWDKEASLLGLHTNEDLRLY